MTVVEEIRARLFQLSDPKYRDFTSALMPTVAGSAVIGVRLPELKRLAKSLITRADVEEFLSDLPQPTSRKTPCTAI